MVGIAAEARAIVDEDTGTYHLLLANAFTIVIALKLQA